jgi:acyl dehydratase
MAMIDLSMKGRDLGSVRFPVERGKLAELARAFHDADRVWFDTDAARAAGFDDVPTPPTVTVLADHWRADGALAHAIALGADRDRLLHGEAAWEYVRPLRVGEVITASSRVSDVSEREGRRGGAMTIFRIETVYTGADGDVAARRWDTLIETGARA